MLRAHHQLTDTHRPGAYRSVDGDLFHFVEFKNVKTKKLFS